MKSNNSCTSLRDANDFLLTLHSNCRERIPPDIDGFGMCVVDAVNHASAISHFGSRILLGSKVF